MSCWNQRFRVNRRQRDYPTVLLDCRLAASDCFAVIDEMLVRANSLCGSERQFGVPLTSVIEADS